MLLSGSLGGPGKSRAAANSAPAWSDALSGPAHLQNHAMEQMQQLTLTWLRPPAARTDARPQAVAPPELPSRDRVRRVAALHHRQLVQAKQRTGNHYEAMRAQTEALRQFIQELTPEQSDLFMNMYTEESSAVEREWMARNGPTRAAQPVGSMIASTLSYVIPVVAIAAAIFYLM